VRPEMLWRFLEWTAASFKGRDGDERRHIVGDGASASSCSVRSEVEAVASFMAWSAMWAKCYNDSGGGNAGTSSHPTRNFCKLELVGLLPCLGPHGWRVLFSLSP
jgi:hypothetical protein